MGEYNGVGNGSGNVGNYSGGGGGGSIGGIGSRNMNTVLMMALCWWYQLGQLLGKRFGTSGTSEL